SLRDTATDIGFSFIRARVALLDFESDFVGTTMLRSFQRANRARDAGVKIRTGTGNHARRKGGRVELMLGIEDQGNLHGSGPCRARLLAIEQVQKMRGDGVAVCLNIDPLPMARKVVTVEQH